MEMNATLAKMTEFLVALREPDPSAQSRRKRKDMEVDRIRILKLRGTLSQRKAVARLPEILALARNENKTEEIANGPRKSIRDLPSSLKKLKSDSQLEPENDSSVVPEVALVGVASRVRIAKAGQHKIKLRWPNRDGFA